MPGTYDITYVKPNSYQPYHAEVFSAQICKPTVCNLPIDLDTGETIGSCGPDICTSSPVSGTSVTNIATISIILSSKQHSINNDFGLVTPYDLAIIKTSDVGTGTNDTTVTYTIQYGNI